MNKKFLIFVVFVLLAALFVFTPQNTTAQIGDGYATTNEPCAGLVCGCYNQGSALGKICPDGLSPQLVDCTGTDLAGGLCEILGPNPKITKCVNPSCTTALDCGCSHEVCTSGRCACNNLGSSTGLICENPTLSSVAVPCEGDDFMGGECDSYAGAASINKCVNPTCPLDPDCICDGEIPTPTDEVPTIVPEASTPTPGGPTPTPCYCSSLPDSVFSCPVPDQGQPGKVEGPIFGGGTVPACFKCDVGDCDKLLAAQPTIRYDEIDGNQCKTYSGGRIGTKVIVDGKEVEIACECNPEVCCPRCVQPRVVSGCSASCNFDITGPGGGCPCFGSQCNQIGVTAPPGYGFDYGTSGGTENPDVSCVNFPNAGVKEITLDCPPPGEAGEKCVKEVVIACGCNQNPGDPPGGASSELSSWYKLKDDQFHKLDTINDPIPANPTPYDEDDVQNAPDPACDTDNGSDIRCLNLNQAGVVSSVGDTINLNGAPVSHREWNKTTYAKSSLYTPESFLDYALARKQTNIISTTAELSNLQKNKINILLSDLTITDTTQEGQTILNILEDAARAPYILIIRGDLTVDVDFNVPNPVTASPLPIAFVVEGGENATGDLKIHHSIETMGGVFISDTLDFSYDSLESPYPLKIKGNIITYQPADTTKRKRIDDPQKPSLFVVFDPIVYLNLSSLLSVRSYDWSELSP